MSKSNSKYIYILFTSILLLFTLNTLNSASAALEPQSRIIEYYDINTPLNEEDYIRNLEFHSEYNCTLLFLNESELGNYLSNNPYVPAREIENITDFVDEIDLSVLKSDYYLESDVLEDINGNSYESIKFFIVVENNQDKINNFSLSIDANNPFEIFLSDFFNHLLILAFFLNACFLFYQSYIEKRNDDEIKSRILRNFGIGYVMGTFGIMHWTVYSWISVVHPNLTWSDPLYFDLPVEAFADNYLSVFTLLFLGLAINFIGYTVEKEVQQKKIPILSIHLFVCTSLLFVGIWWNSAMLVIIIWWIIATVLEFINIILTYIKIIVKSQGNIRKMAILIVMGFLGSYGSMVFRDFFSLRYLFDLSAIIFTFIFYKGITFESRIE